MPREDSPYIVGDYWLDKRRDGKSPDIWQITRYDSKSRSVIYRSTRESCLDAARKILDAHHAREVTRGPQQADEAEVIPLLVTYWEEHGRTVERPDTIASSIRVVIGFLMQDEATTRATVKDLGFPFQRRFVAWRMGPHSYEVPWAGKIYRHTSKGVKGETVQRNIEDLRAGINHHVNMGRLPNMPRIPSVPEGERSTPRERVLSYAELGAMLGYARQRDRGMFQRLALMLGTAVRPEAAARFDPEQYDAEHGFIDLQPKGKKRTKKRNPVVPAIEPLKPILEAWERVDVLPSKRARSHRTEWRTMRRALGLSNDVMGNTIRHTVASMLRADPKCPRGMIDDLLGHDMEGSATSRGYAKYDPAYMRPVKIALTKIFDRAMQAADAWAAVHLLTIPRRGVKLAVVKRDEKL
ncbi:Integrase, catalytic domain containing protein [uncultured Caudovirales phage]|uniref:Integrase, catalytic domain containing protein n=1 Tax=uncultured Caudovirales phage TaxID=2100421 RepID=A0A6J5LZT4_9CAUD|nr:Integrase, catalytic domain containing protein [uncultured Caudovirales phage]